MTRQSSTTYSPEFKREAVQLLESGEKDAAKKGVGDKCDAFALIGCAFEFLN